MRKRIAATWRQPQVEPPPIGTTWSVDVTHATLANGRTFRTLNIIDRVSRVCHAITVDTSLPGARVIREFERVVALVGQPEQIRVDNGPEFISRALDSTSGRTWPVRTDHVQTSPFEALGALIFLPMARQAK